MQDAAADGARFNDQGAHAHQGADRRQGRVIACGLRLLAEDRSEPEGGTFARHRFDVNAALHHFDQLLANGKTQAGAAVLARGRAVGLCKLVKDA